MIKNTFYSFLISLLFFTAAVSDDLTMVEPVADSTVATTEPEIVHQQARVVKLKKRLKECPPDMEYIIVDYNPKAVYEICIDRYEYPNQAGRFPMVDVTWYKAKRLCKSMGKYLCWDKEWLEACTGMNNWDFGYYNVFDESKCNVKSKTFNKIGDNKECKTHGYEVFDLVGNVREWTGGGGVGASGGYFKSRRGARCSKWDALSLKKTYKNVGFRCCAKVFTGRYGKYKKDKKIPASTDSLATDTTTVSTDTTSQEEVAPVEPVKTVPDSAKN